MATFPAVGDVERDDALARLDRRHREYEDSRWSEAGDEPREVLDYLVEHRARLARLPRELAQGDVWDELVLTAWVHWDDRRREATVLHQAIRRGLSLREVGRFVGVHTAQGMRDYLDSLDARLREYRRHTRDPDPTRIRSPAPGGRELLIDDTAARADHEPDQGDDAPSRRSRNPYLRYQGRSRAVRGADGQYTRDRRAAERARPARERWLADQHDQVVVVLVNLLEQAERLGLAAASEPDASPVLGDYLSWIRDDLSDGIDDATLHTLGLALRALRSEPTVIELAPQHGVHRAIGAADGLRADHASLRPDRVRTVDDRS
ncbi:hypothetical protein [Actinomycetospora termitidis]|uniref:Uncharacterized protein n=1 Tax=Actinomycetospora termitidis TaxID=3053470 RepID=A0ABT7MIF5_9PSEU|nr:hypothetical protein [Actinomycetospora sp. Odt1-22]MDL5160459.1 hypothetical protein [Actinomycetospora sp. Odt1-22]